MNTQTKECESTEKNKGFPDVSSKLHYGDISIIAKAANVTTRTVHKVLNEGIYRTMTHQKVLKVAIFVADSRVKTEQKILAEAIMVSKHYDELNSPDHLMIPKSISHPQTQN